MTPKQKIAKVLKKIKGECEINEDTDFMQFDLNTRVISLRYLSADEERRILLKLERKGIIKLVTVPSLEGSSPSEFMIKNSFILVLKLPGFKKHYYYYKSYLLVHETKELLGGLLRWFTQHYKFALVSVGIILVTIFVIIGDIKTQDIATALIGLIK